MNILLKYLYRNTKPNSPIITDAENIESKTIRSIIKETNNTIKKLIYIVLNSNRI